MNEIRLYNILKEGYDTTTCNHNSFKQVIESISWDGSYEAAGETCYTADSFLLIVENENPFNEAYSPCIIFSDGSMVNF